MCYALAASVSGARTEALQRLVLLLASFRSEAADDQHQSEAALAAALAECDPENGVSHLLVARIALRHGDRDGCVESLERAARCARWQFYGGEFPGRTSQQFARSLSGSLVSRQAVVGPVGDGIRFFEGTAPIFWIRGNQCCEELALEIRKTPLNPQADREAAMQVARLRVHAYLCSVRLIAAEDASSFDWLIGNTLWKGMQPLAIAPSGDEQDELQRLDDVISRHFQSYRRQQDAQRQAEDGGEAPRSAFERHAARAIDEGPSWSELLRQSGLTAEFVEASVAAILATSANPDR
ncbi:MAG: hypothetical protein KF774_10560 [Planctomyces sp.]|nr:hypothetical protein [Planctomyces sp.]